MKKRVIIISLDALSGSEFSLISGKKGFGKIIEEGAFCKDELSVFPSLTFPCHASIATGCTPGHHGIVHNYLLKPEADRDYWNFYASNLKRRAIWDYAAQDGKKVLSMSWPVSSGADILWSMPEMTPAKPKIWQPEIFDEQMQIFRDYGNGKFAEEVFRDQPNLIRYWFEGKQPELDEQMLEGFLKQVCIRNFDIALLHVYGMDNIKHIYGRNSDEAHSYLSLYDTYVQKFLTFSDNKREEGEDISVLITGDHAQKDVRYLCYGNEVLRRAGLLSSANGHVEDCDAYFHGGGGMAYLYVFDKEHKEKILEKCKTLFEGNPAVSEVFTADRAEELGCDPNADLIFAAADGYAMERAMPKELVDKWGIGLSEDLKADHGYLPDDESYRTMFFAYGPSVRRHFEISSMCITDITPSVCCFLGMKTDKMDGIPVKDLFL